MIDIGMISLGCPKNMVDSELILGELKGEGRIVGDPANADVIIVNTCGFIEASKQESIDTILEMAEYKQHGKLKGLIVTGCLSERYTKELADELPEVDAFLGISAYSQIVDAVRAVMRGERFLGFECKYTPAFDKRPLTTPHYMAYIRVADGCNNRCSYCAIPYIRGEFRSRTIEDIEAEVLALRDRGVKEFVLVAQDTTKYGYDLGDGTDLSTLIDKLAVIDGVKWLRMLYAYPESIDEKLIRTMAKYDNVVKYIDMPVQHTCDNILSKMNRKGGRNAIFNAVKIIRETSPDFIIRTTLISGFPGETEAEHEALLEDIKELQFDRLGVFEYSPEDGTPAATFAGQIPDEIKRSRAESVMIAQADISLKLNERRIGREYEAVIEDSCDGGYLARTYAEAPDIDGLIFIETDKEFDQGDFIDIRIIDADEYDLVGELI